MKNKMLIGFIVTLAVVGTGFFYGGMQYGKSQAASAVSQVRQQRGGGQGGQFNRAVRAGANFINGDIIAADNTSITVQDQNGGSKIIFLSGSTQISKFAAGSVSDLTVGQAVSANGTTNSDGSITAQMIQLRPARPKNASSTPFQKLK